MMKLLRRRGNPKAGLQDVLRDYELQPFPRAVMEVLRALRDPELDAEQLAVRVEADPGLVIQVLKTVNSAAFGLRQPVESVGHALAMMGRSRLESLVLALAVRDALPTVNRGAFESGRFWTAAARRATVARALAARYHPATQAFCFTAGLLQDMAIPVLVAARGAEYDRVLASWHASEDANLEDLEREEFAWDHAEIGTLMAQQWGFPQSLIDAIGGHHEGDGDQAVLLVAHLREAHEDAGLARMRAAAAAIQWDPTHVNEVVEEAFDQASDLAAFLA